MPIDLYKRKLQKKVKKGNRGYPLATVAYYGPDNSRASKVVCTILEDMNTKPKSMKKWFSDTVTDARYSEEISREIIDFIQENEVSSVGMIDKIIGCPHEEDIDYPLGKSCPECPFWQNRNRWTDEIIN